MAKNATKVAPASGQWTTVGAKRAVTINVKTAKAAGIAEGTRLKVTPLPGGGFVARPKTGESVKTLAGAALRNSSGRTIPGARSAVKAASKQVKPPKK